MTKLQVRINLEQKAWIEWATPPVNDEEQVYREQLNLKAQQAADQIHDATVLLLMAFMSKEI